VTYSSPFFIGIGAVKSGTTWLHHTLARHPDVWVPPIKELRYFDQPEYNLIERLRGGQSGRYDYSYWQAQLKNFLRSPPLRHPKSVFWHLWYFFGPRSPWWYASLFPDRPCTGEISPLYAPVPREKIERAHRHFPHLDVVYLLRDPIDRIWSHIRMRCLGLPEVDGDPDRLTPDVVFRTVAERDLDDRWLFRHSRYADNLERWLSVFPREQVFVGYFDDVRERPRSLLERLSRFLDLSHPASPPAPSERRNTRPIDLALPPDLETIFARRLLGDVRRLDDRLEADATRAWRERAERAAARSVDPSSRFSDDAPEPPDSTLRSSSSSPYS
jgi:hypothetical protein